MVSSYAANNACKKRHASPPILPDSDALNIFHKNMQNLFASDSVFMGKSPLSASGWVKSTNIIFVASPVAASVGAGSISQSSLPSSSRSERRV